MGMRAYVIRQGDYLTKLACAMGFDADAVWNHAKNRDLKEKRPNHDILQPGDILHVPTPEPRAGLSLSANTSNKYKGRVATVEIKLRLRDAHNAAIAGKAYRVIGTGRPLQGTTDGDGVATFSVPVRLREVRLVLEESGRAYQLMIGDMDPIAETSGVRKRLQHLGHLAAGAGGATDEALGDAIRGFQTAQEITATGELDQATRDALVSAHGS